MSLRISNRPRKSRPRKSRVAEDTKEQLQLKQGKETRKRRYTGSDGLVCKSFDETGKSRKVLPDFQDNNKIVEAAKLILKAKNIVFIVGAGISTSCGIPDFRSRGGLYETVEKLDLNIPQPECLFDIAYFRDDPEPFYKFINNILPPRYLKGKIEPSKMHRFIKIIEERRKLRRVYTQNIDGLEHTAGIRRVVYCHGSFFTFSCLNCRLKLQTLSLRSKLKQKSVMRCSRLIRNKVCEGLIKPDIKFFGENLSKQIDRSAASDRDKCDLLIISGTSLKVAPISTLPLLFPDNVPKMLINDSKVQLNKANKQFDLELLGACDELCGKICKQLEWKI